jgi:hypothetical protein
MKTKHVLLLTVLTLALTLPMFGQHTHDDKTKTHMKQQDMSSMMGKPTVDATVEGVHMEVWIMTQKQHKEMMEGKMGQMMMHGEKEGAMGRMEMKGMKDTSMRMGRDLEVMKHESLGKDINVMKHDSMGMGKEIKVMKHETMGMGKDTKGMKHDGMGMNKAMMDSMMAGTHHIMLDVTDATSGKEIANASAKVMIVFPSKKSSSVDLRPKMSHFGGALALDETGEYRFTIDVNVGGVSKTTQFQYAVK